jgi:hypothetical protein
LLNPFREALERPVERTLGRVADELSLDLIGDSAQRPVGLYPAELNAAAQERAHLIEVARYGGEACEVVVVVGARAERRRAYELRERDLRPIELVEDEELGGIRLALDRELELPDDQRVGERVLAGEA